MRCAAYAAAVREAGKCAAVCGDAVVPFAVCGVFPGAYGDGNGIDDIFKMAPILADLIDGTGKGLYN